MTQKHEGVAMIADTIIGPSQHFYDSMPICILASVNWLTSFGTRYIQQRLI